MTIWIILAGLVYFLSWLWLFLRIMEHTSPVSSDMREAPYNADDVTVPLFY